VAENQDLRFRFLADARDFLRKNRDVQGGLGRTDKAVSRSSQAWSGMQRAVGAVGLAFGAGQVAKWAGDAIQLAVAAEEVESKFDAVYGSAEDLRSQLEAWGDMAGVTTTQAMDLAATFGNLAQAQGITAENTQDLALDVAELAGDMASFNDKDPAEVFRDLNKALLTTEREGMKKYDIAITEAEVKTRAAAIAAAEGRDEVTKADRAYASYAIAVEQAGQAVGDLERTQDSAANKQRRMQKELRDMQEEIGKELLPVYNDLLEVMVDLAPALGAVGQAAGAAVRPIADLTSAAGDLDSWGGRIESGWTAAGEALQLVFGGAARQVYLQIKDLNSVAKEMSEKEGPKVKSTWDSWEIVTRSINAQLSQLRREMGTPLPDESADDAADKMNDLARAIIAAKREHLNLREELGKPLNVPRTYHPGDADFLGNPSDAITQYNNVNGTG